jgi:hypothetical protein
MLSRGWADISRMKPSAYRLAALALAPAAFLTLGVAAQAGGATTPTAQVRVTVKDFRIVVPRSVTGGDLLLTVINKGPDNHELIVVRKPSSRMPFRSDGLTVDEDALRRVKQPSLEAGPPGGTRMLRLTLKRGRYVFFCNMSGHFLAGMHAELVVR